ncbi:MAG: type II toxin-antitoxin system VapC family toxin [Planctomycetota bacterium]|nr:type II toxin-antitoxin system VapC family toxin [Planctomycetota bacterium]
MFDTNICVFALRQSNTVVPKQLSAHADDGIVLSVITSAELRYGAE